MLEKGRISTLQMEFIIVPAVLATSILSIPAITGRLARHDMWMTPIIGSITGFLIVFIIWKLHQFYPKMTPVQYMEEIIGKIAGRAFGFSLILVFLHRTGISVRDYSDFLTSNVMLHTPELVFTISMIFVCALAARGGIEVIARTAVICTALFMGTAIVLLLLIKDIDITYMLPIFENGVLPVLKGGFINHSWFTDFFFLGFIFPFLNNQEKGLKAGMRSSFVVMFIFVYLNFFVLTLIGISCINQFYPVYAIVRAISVFEFFENFEVLVTASWVLGNFVKFSFFLYVISLSLGQLFRLSDFRILVFPMGLLLMFFGYWDLPNLVASRKYLAQIHPFVMTFFQFLLPLFLLMIAIFRKKWREKRR
ncbi:GerAB/ArcD/ProY family transporter [Bacillus dakarensis]|uniref:GerAB/ArcD/ProY family transporter n=1 Tax=Robertmurraya dakarensis TaxID=1926278 RepID=UPI001F227820|nr:endospore germination permease [Bacillus dakarensis]